MSDETEVRFNKYCCLLCCYETEPVKMSVKVPMKGYAPGQAIEITINVDNKSDQTYYEFIGNIYKVNFNIKLSHFYTENKLSVATLFIFFEHCAFRLCAFQANVFKFLLTKNLRKSKSSKCIKIFCL